MFSVSEPITATSLGRAPTIFAMDTLTFSEAETHGMYCG